MDPGKDTQSVDAKVHGENDNQESTGIVKSKTRDTFTTDTVARLKTRLIEEESKRQRLENNVKLLTKRIQRLELAQESQTLPRQDSVTTPTIYFVARLSKDLKCQGREVIMFDQVLVNEGGGYSATTGVFTVPVTGLYLITCSLSVNGKRNKTRAYLMRNDAEVSRMKLECDVSRWCRDYGTLSLPILLTSGDIVYVECEKSIEGDELSTFSAVLLK